MKLRFGLHLDGQHGRHASNQLGGSDVGPLGLVTILETQFGLVPPQVSSSERIVQYRDCLLKIDDTTRFFHQSLAADDFGTAATLLASGGDGGDTNDVAVHGLMLLEQMS